jgi:hypothetical protein
MLQDADALPQLIGDYKPVDQWQVHINWLFYRFRGDQVRNFYQTFASADYRLAHALAADYYTRVRAREQAKGTRREASGNTEDAPSPRPSPLASRLVVHEWGPGNGNLAACFLSHLKTLDKDGTIYPRIQYVLVDWEQAVLDAVMSRPDLASHRDHIQTLQANVDRLETVADGTVDRIICNELWNDLPTKLMSRQGSEIEEEFLRPNISETLYPKIDDWSAFVRAFEAKDADTLKTFPPFFEDLVWEKEHRTVDWKDVPFRKTITEFLKKIDDQVLVPVNLGACATIKEAKRVLAPDAIGFSSFDAGTADMKVLNDPDKPCYGQFGGQYSFMVNFALIGAVAKQLGIATVNIETQREFVGRSLNTNVLTLVDLLAVHPSARSQMQAWEQDRLIIKTIHALNGTYSSPYRRTLDFSLRQDTPAEEREALQGILSSMKPQGVPDTIAYLTEEELLAAMKDLEELGYERDAIMMALAAPPAPVEYHHLFFAP